MSSTDPQSESFPPAGRVAAVDYGTVRIGIAICDPERILASPLDVISATACKEDGEYFRRLANDERITGFVVGLPIHCDGGESQKSQEAREFARWLAEQTKLPVRLFDERFTTTDANQRIAGGGFTRDKKKRRVDAIAAQVLLESFLEACRYGNNIAGQSISSKPIGGDSLDG